ncbi:MAG: phosphatase PAP2 family protein [Spirochaetales bacterium]|nr:phosphatase PAP2 family protein [Spirochaetales bacterium]
MKRSAFAVLIILLAVCLHASAEPTYPFDSANVNSFDRTFMKSYDKKLDDAGTVLEIAALLSPAVLFSESPDQYLKIGVMYAETLALAWGTTEIIKRLADRPRPYMYYEGYPQDKVDSGSWNRSFPSGHTTMSFAGASFASYVFWKYNPESKWRIPVTTLSYSLAISVAALRVASGNHFATDVLAGALIGTAIGIGVPALHTLFADKDTSLSVSPFGLVFSRSY